MKINFRVLKILFLTIFLFVSPQKFSIQQIDFQQNKNFICGFLPREKDKELSQKLDSYFVKLCREKLFNGTFLVAKNGKIVYENFFGYKNFKKRDTLTQNSIFQIASASKQFTSVAIMMLKEQGKLNFDDKITRFFPEFPYKEITIRQLLTHRSGLSEYMYFCETLTDRNTPISNQNLVNLMIKEKPTPYYSPNYKFNYRNTNYALLAAIVEKISGQKFSDFVKKNIFEPLEMKNSFVYEAPNLPNLPDITQGHTFRGRLVEPIYLDGISGDKNVYSTAEDLFRWDQGLYNEILLKRNTLEEAFQNSIIERKKASNYGFGFRLKTLENGTKMVFHGGWWHGYNALLIRLLQNKATIIFLTNRENLSFLITYNEVLEILFPELKKTDTEIDLLECLNSKK